MSSESILNRIEPLGETVPQSLQPIFDLEEMAPTLIIEAGRGEQQYWRDLWSYRELAYFLAWRDVLVRYKQTAIGVAWSVLRPVITMLIGTFIFEKVLRLTSIGEVPYAILIYTAILPWQFFADGLMAISNSLIGNANMISKVYFPRLILPVSKIFVSLMDFAISFLVLVLLMVWYHFVGGSGFTPSWQMFFLPFFLALASATAIGAGLWFAALNVKYRDVMYVVPFIVQFGIYISSVFFSSERIPGCWRLVYSLNPMVGVIDGFRWCILGPQSAIYWPGLLASVAVVIAMLMSGLWYFRRTERTFADMI